MSKKNVELNTIAGELQSWVDFQAKKGPVTDDTHIMAPPEWPSVGVIKNWIKVIQEAAQELE